MKFTSALYGYLFLSGKAKFFTLHKIASFVTSLYILALAMTSFYEFYSFQINQSSILEKAKIHKFPLENLENIAISYKHMGYVSGFCLIFNIILSYLSQSLSIKLFKAFKVKSKVLWFSTLLCCHALYLAIYSIIKIEDNFPFLWSDMLKFSKKLGWNFYPIKILLLSGISLEYSFIIHFIFPSIVIVNIVMDILTLLDKCQSTPIISLTVFSQATDLFSNSFIKRILNYCKSIGFDCRQIYVTDSDSYEIKVLQTMAAAKIIMPLSAVTYYKNDLFAPLISKIYEVCNSFELKINCLVILFMAALGAIYLLLINKCKKSNAKCLSYELMNCQKIIYFIHFLFILVLKALLRRYQLKSDDYLIKLGFHQNLGRMLIKMSENKKESNLIYHTSAGAILSSSHSLMRRMERINEINL